jgi:hypothetical protein
MTSHRANEGSPVETMQLNELDNVVIARGDISPGCYAPIGQDRLPVTD